MPSPQADHYFCEVCEGGDDEPLMLLCEGCDMAYHTYCLLPPLVKVAMCLLVSFCVFLCLFVSSCVFLCLLVSSCVFLCLLVSSYVSLCLLVSSCVFVCLFVSLCFLALFVSLCVCVYLSLLYAVMNEDDGWRMMDDE